MLWNSGGGRQDPHEIHNYVILPDGVILPCGVIVPGGVILSGRIVSGVIVQDGYVVQCVVGHDNALR